MPWRAQDLREIPSAVCGDIKMRHGIVLAKSIPAGACGHDFRCAEKISGPYDASPRYSLYETSSRALLSILRDFAPGVKQYSTDEACCGMTGAAALCETIGMRRRGTGQTFYLHPYRNMV